MLDHIQPVSSNEAFADAVFERVKKRKRIKTYRMITTILIVTILLGLTITAGATTGWDYTAVARYFFGDAVIVREGMHDEINFTIVENTFDVFTFEVIGLYADETSILLAMSVIADDPIFNNRQYPSLWPAGRSLYDHSSERLVRCYWTATTSVISDNELIIVNEFTVIDGIISGGKEYSVLFDRIEWSGGLNNDLTGRVELRFLVNELALENSVTVFPNIVLSNDNILIEAHINPFFINLLFEGSDIPKADQVLDNIAFIDNDGDEINITAAFSGLFDADGNKLGITRQGAVIVDAGGNADSYEGKIYDANGNAVSLIADSVRVTDYQDERYSVIIHIEPFTALNIRNIAAIVYDDIVIPLDG
jgi:hypothetical protein